MDIKDLKTLIKLVTDSDISEFEMENGDQKVIIKRGSDKEIVQVAAPQVMAPMPAAAPAAPAPPAAAPAEAPPAPQDDKYEVITSPIVGTFYRKPAPDADNFVEVGTVAESGMVLCLVEAMKLFNEIEAEFKCRIIEILKDDASPVEFGEALFKVERV